jgi:hypothetical protein
MYVFIIDGSFVAQVFVSQPVSHTDINIHARASSTMIITVPVCHE